MKQIGANLNAQKTQNNSQNALKVIVEKIIWENYLISIENLTY